MKKMTAGRLILNLASILMLVIFLAPLIWSLAVSIKTEGTPISNAWDWFKPPYTLENYPAVIGGTNVPMWTWNSFWVAAVVTVVSLVLSSLAAYAIAKLPFKGKQMMYVYFLLGLMVPTEATIVPLFITVNGMEMIDTFAGLIFPSVAGSMNMIIMVNFFKGVPDELIEAATIDGAGTMRIFSTIILPLSRTVMVTVAIFAFIGSWNNYLWPLLCAMSERMFTLPIGIPTLVGTYTVDYVIPLTANMVASIPAIILFIIFEKQITQSVALSGVKG